MRLTTRKDGPPISWSEFHTRYRKEMAARKAIDELAQRSAAGETLTLLCSSACVNAERCQRTLLRQLIETRAGRVKR